MYYSNPSTLSEIFNKNQTRTLFPYNTNPPQSFTEIPQISECTAALHIYKKSTQWIIYHDFVQVIHSANG